MSSAGTLIVVHDGGCGECVDIAARLRTVLRPTVLARTCRDPELLSSHPALRALGCRAPAVGRVRADGTVRWSTGVPAALVVLRGVRLGRLPGALACSSGCPGRGRAPLSSMREDLPEEVLGAP